MQFGDWGADAPGNSGAESSVSAVRFVFRHSSHEPSLFSNEEESIPSSSSTVMLPRETANISANSFTDSSLCIVLKCRDLFISSFLPRAADSDSSRDIRCLGLSLLINEFDGEFVRQCIA